MRTFQLCGIIIIIIINIICKLLSHSLAAFGSNDDVHQYTGNPIEGERIKSNCQMHYSGLMHLYYRHDWKYNVMTLCDMQLLKSLDNFSVLELGEM